MSTITRELNIRIQRLSAGKRGALLLRLKDAERIPPGYAREDLLGELLRDIAVAESLQGNGLMTR